MPGSGNRLWGAPRAFSLGAILAILLSLPTIFPSAASPRAACGLHSSGLFTTEAAGTGEPPRTAIGLTLRRTAIEQAGDPGAYSEMDFEAHYAASPAWVFGAQWPVARIELRGSDRIGLGDPALQSEFRMPLGAARLGLGAQLELPLGDAAHGFASDHFMGAAYASLSRDFARTKWSGSVGTASMLPWMDGHAAGMDHTSMRASMPGMEMPASGTSTSLDGLSLGNPHENWELLYRIGFGADLFPGHAAVAAALEGQHVLSEPMGMDPEKQDADERDFLTAELGMPLTFGAGEVFPFVRGPVSPARRTGWTFGLRTGLAW